MVTPAQALSSQTDPTVFLFGRPPMGEALAFLQHSVEEGFDIAASAERWRLANDHVIELEQSEAGAADDHLVGDLPDEVRALALKVVNDPVVRETYAVVPFTIGLVELDRLIVFQKHINLAHVEQIKERIPTAPSVADLFTIALPIGRDRSDPALHGQLVGNDAAGNHLFAFRSVSTDARVLATKLVDANDLSEIRFGGIPVKLVVTAVGFGSNLLSAIQVGTRLVLANGSHRAYALRDAGIDRVPCLVQHVTRREELPIVGNPELTARHDAYFVNPRPPLLRDYFDDRLRVIAPVPQKVRDLRVVVQPQELDAPAS